MSQIRIIRNRHESAKAALDKWLNGSLWGDAIDLGRDHYHVYGAWRRRWRPVSVEFMKSQITIVNE
uniref:Uncharacterized protein n=1 Tax=viral metagenome TaxID=1070528 RepID=A0A6M3L8U4_9ZZZZ